MTQQSSADKTLYSTTNTFGILRKELIESLGLEHAKYFLLRYGWNIGESHAKEVAKKNLSLREKLDSAATFHLNSGQITDLKTERILELYPDDTVKYMYAKGVWINSYEMFEHLKYFGQSTTCICHTLAGYASGYTSYLTNLDIHIVETTCRARGDKECSFEMRLFEEWDEETQASLLKIKATRMIDTLNSTYEELYKQKQLAERVSSFHNHITLGVAQGLTIEQILEIIYADLQLPILIQDLNFHHHYSVGATDDEIAFYMRDFAEHMPQTRAGKISLQPIDPLEPLHVACHNHTRLISPITVQQQVIGYISFIYPANSVEAQTDLHFVQRSAVAISLCYLNEKSSLEAIENIKAYFFEQLLQKQYTSKQSVIHRSYLLQIDLNEPFYIGQLAVQLKGQKVTDPAMLASIIQAFVVYLEMHQISIFITNYQDNIIFLFPKVNETHEHFANIIKHLNRKFKHYDVRIGVSRALNDIDDIEEAYRQAVASINIDKKSAVVYFEETNILGSLINKQNSFLLSQLAQQELQPILQLKPHKKEEFLKTLYTFLKNNGNLQQTVIDLSLSMSGLVYRIQKIEELLNRELRNSKNVFELTLLLESLIVLGELEIE